MSGTLSKGLQLSDILSKGMQSSDTLSEGVHSSDTLSEGVHLSDNLSEGVQLSVNLSVGTQILDTFLLSHASSSHIQNFRLFGNSHLNSDFLSFCRPIPKKYSLK